MSKENGPATDEAPTTGDWCHRIIEGVGGMNDYERYEIVAWNQPERIAAANWTLQCLANPDCEGSAGVLEAIMQKRREREAEKATSPVPA